MVRIARNREIDQAISAREKKKRKTTEEPTGNHSMCFGMSWRLAMDRDESRSCVARCSNAINYIGVETLHRLNEKQRFRLSNPAVIGMVSSKPNYSEQVCTL